MRYFFFCIVAIMCSQVPMAICLEATPSRARFLSKCALTAGALGLIGVVAHKLNGGDVVRRARALKRIKLAALLAIIVGGVGLIATHGNSSTNEQEALGEPEIEVASQIEVVSQNEAPEIVQDAPVVMPVASISAIDPGVRAYRIQFVSNILKNSRLSDCQKRGAIKLQLPLLLTSYDPLTSEETGYTTIAGYYAALASPEEKEAIVRVVGPVVALERPQEVRKCYRLQELAPLPKSEVESAFRSVERQDIKSTEAEVLMMARVIGQLIVAQGENIVPVDKRYFDLYKKLENSVRRLTRDRERGGSALGDELNDLVAAIDGHFLPRSFAFCAKRLIDNPAWLIEYNQIYERLKEILIPFSLSLHRGFALDKELCRQVLAQVEERFKNEKWLGEGRLYVNRLFEKPSHVWAGRISVWEKGILPELLSFFPKGAFPAIEGYATCANNYLREKAL